MQIRLADKSVVSSTQVATITLTFAPSVEQQLKFRVVPLLHHGMILGMHWFSTVNPVINWQQRSVAMVIAGKAIRLACGKAKLSSTVQLCTFSQLCQSAQHSKHDTSVYAVRVDTVQGSALTTQASGSTANTWNQLCAQYADVFESPGTPKERAIKHRIDLLEPTRPIKHHRQYRMSQREMEEVHTQITDLLSKGWIRPSTSQYNHPILFVKKKEGTLRMCIDYRSLNENTIIDRYPLPRIDDILDRLGGSTIFSKIDLQSGYHQVAIEPGHEHRTAFQSRFGLYEYTVLPFGLCNAPSTFQRLVNEIFREHLDEYITVYLDDLLIFSRSPAEHEQHLKWVFDKLREHSLKAKLSKCAFGLESIEYLGHVVSKEGVAMDPAKVRAIAECAAPTCVKELQMFLGMCNYYGKFISNFANIAAPLYSLLSKDQPWSWSSAQAKAFDALKHALSSAPVLRMPDFSSPFVLETDASDVAVGGVLTQHGHPVAYFSKSLNSAERNYPTHDREFLAIVLCCRRWRPYLDGQGQRTVVYTDHKPLVHIFSQTDLSKRQVRWLEKLADTPISIQYRPGREGVVPDMLSCIGADSDGFTPVLSFVGKTQGTGKEAEAELSFVGKAQGTATVNTVLVEPSFLQRISKAQFDKSDSELARFVALAQSLHPDFRIVHRHGIPLVVKVHGTVELVVLPAAHGFRQLLMNECHVTPLSGHFGCKKVVNLLRQRVWWPKMRASVSAFCKDCEVCARTKDSTLAAPGELQPLPVPPKRFHSWSLDFITDLPVSHGCNTILTVVDRLTKYVRLIPCFMGGNRLSAAAVASLFLQHIVRQFGVPRELVHDRDPRFTALFWQEFWKALGTKTHATTAYRPQSDGQTERVNRTLAQVLRAHCLDAPETNWYTSLPLVEFAINTTTNVSTGFSPFYMLYGEAVPLPIDHALLDDAKASTTASDLINHVQSVVATARKRMEAAQQAQKRYYDKHHTPMQFEVGDWVLLSTKHLQLPSSRKLGPRFIGPLQVLSKIGSQAYKLELPPSLSQHHPVFHVSLLRQAPHTPHPQHPLGSPSTPISIQQSSQSQQSPKATKSPPQRRSKNAIPSDVYEVERIIAERKKKFKVRWTGYDAAEDSWIHKDELRKTAPLVVARWEEKVTQATPRVLRPRRH